MDETTQDILKATGASLVRHVMTGAATWLVGQNIIAPADEASTVSTLSGIALGLIGFGWSWWNKSGHAQAIAARDALLRRHSIPTPPK